MRLASVFSLLAFTGTAFANQGTFNPNVAWDGPNPTNVGFGLYLPPKVNPGAPVVVVVHWCQGSGTAAYQGSGIPAIADQYGFPMIFPDSPNTANTKCWDVGSKQTLSHNAGGDSLSIVNMVKYVVKKYNCDASRVFITGGSSGGMMTQVLAGAYPDVFAAGAEVAGVPFGCWANNGVAQWNSDCAQGHISHTGAEWAQIVKNAYPGYTGPRPKLQLYHGTADTTVNYNNFKEAVKEWTAVFGISETPSSTEQNSPQSGWTKTVYGTGQLEGYSAAGVGHAISYQTGLVSKFFDLTCAAGSSSCFHRSDSSVPTTSPPNPTDAPVPTPTTSAVNDGGAARWGQCGGNGWSGATTCKEGKCVKVNDWYSQCQ